MIALWAIIYPNKKERKKQEKTKLDKKVKSYAVVCRAFRCRDFGSLVWSLPTTLAPLWYGDRPTACPPLSPIPSAAGPVPLGEKQGRSQSHRGHPSKKPCSYIRGRRWSNPDTLCLSCGDSPGDLNPRAKVSVLTLANLRCIQSGIHICLPGGEALFSPMHCEPWTTIEILKLFCAIKLSKSNQKILRMICWYASY